MVANHQTIFSDFRQRPADVDFNAYGKKNNLNHKTPLSKQRNNPLRSVEKFTTS